MLARWQAGGLRAERHVGHRGTAGMAAAERVADPGTDRSTRANGGADDAGADDAGAEDEPAPGEPGKPLSTHPRSRHDAGFQWKVKLTRCGVSHTSWYSRWRAETGGETSSDSL